MSADQSKRKELLESWIQALNARDLSRLDQLAEEISARDSVTHDPDFPDLGRGHDSWKKFAHRVLADNSNLDIKLEDFFGEGDKTAVRLTVRATNAASGKTVTFPVLDVIHWVGDQVTEEWQLAGPAEAQA